jgi:hypothetical protein
MSFLGQQHQQAAIGTAVMTATATVKQMRAIAALHAAAAANDVAAIAPALEAGAPVDARTGEDGAAATASQ